MTKSKYPYYHIEVGPFPINIFYTPTEQSWCRLLNKYKIDFQPYPTSDGRCTTFWRDNGNPVTIITFSETVTKLKKSGVIGLVTHECVHAYQAMVESMQEDCPSVEFEAYSIGGLVQEVLESMIDAGTFKL